MALDEEKRARLVEFLDKMVFDPVLRVDDSKYDENARQKLAEVKRSTANEKRRFHDDYRSAIAVKQNYLSDLDSPAAARKNKALEELGLPRMYQVRDDFLKLCEQMRV
ncbi:MAG: hypothetical protein AB7U81_08880 [Thiohalomonadaceae bacterium]